MNGMQLLLFRHIPKPNRGPVRRGDQPAVRGDSKRRDTPLMPLEGTRLLSGRRVPEPEDVAKSAPDDRPAVWTESSLAGRRGDDFQPAQFLARGQIPEL